MKIHNKIRCTNAFGAREVKMELIRKSYRIFADYFHFYIQDESAVGDLANSWNKEATANSLAIADGIIGIGTVRNMEVPVEIVINEKEPIDNIDEYDKINECSIEIKSEKIVIAGCTDYFPEAERIKMDNGIYTVRIYYKNLDSLSEDGLDGDDTYKVVMWKDGIRRNYKKIR